MTAKGYCENTDVQAFLGLTFSSAALAYAASRIESAENRIDNYTHRGWLVGPQTDERHERLGYWNGHLWLRYAPLASVETITGRSYLGGDETTLVAGSDYEVVDLAQGLVDLVLPWSWERLLVSYTPVDTVPTDIRDAAAELVAWWMQPSLRPDTYGLFSMSLPDLTMRFAFHDTDALPPGVSDKLDPYVFPAVGAQI